MDIATTYRRLVRNVLLPALYENVSANASLLAKPMLHESGSDDGASASYKRHTLVPTHENRQHVTTILEGYVRCCLFGTAQTIDISTRNFTARFGGPF